MKVVGLTGLLNLSLSKLTKENRILAEPFNIQTVVELVSLILLPFNRFYGGTMFL